MKETTGKYINAYLAAIYGVAIFYSSAYMFWNTCKDKTPTTIDIIGNDVNDKITGFKTIAVEEDTDANGDPKLMLLK